MLLLRILLETASFQEEFTDFLEHSAMKYWGAIKRVLQPLLDSGGSDAPMSNSAGSVEPVAKISDIPPLPPVQSGPRPTERLGVTEEYDAGSSKRFKTDVDMLGMDTASGSAPPFDAPYAFRGLISQPAMLTNTGSVIHSTRTNRAFDIAKSILEGLDKIPDVRKRPLDGGRVLMQRPSRVSVNSSASLRSFGSAGGRSVGAQSSLSMRIASSKTIGDLLRCGQPLASARTPSSVELFGSEAMGLVPNKKSRLEAEPIAVPTGVSTLVGTNDFQSTSVPQHTASNALGNMSDFKHVSDPSASSAISSSESKSRFSFQEPAVALPKVSSPASAPKPVSKEAVTGRELPRSVASDFAASKGSKEPAVSGSKGSTIPLVPPTQGFIWGDPSKVRPEDFIDQDNTGPRSPSGSNAGNDDGELPRSGSGDVVSLDESPASKPAAAVGAKNHQLFGFGSAGSEGNKTSTTSIFGVPVEAKPSASSKATSKSEKQGNKDESVTSTGSIFGSAGSSGSKSIFGSESDSGLFGASSSKSEPMFGVSDPLTGTSQPLFGTSSLLAGMQPGAVPSKPEAQVTGSIFGQATAAPLSSAGGSLFGIPSAKETKSDLFGAKSGASPKSLPSSFEPKVNPASASGTGNIFGSAKPFEFGVTQASNGSVAEIKSSGLEAKSTGLEAKSTGLEAKSTGLFSGLNVAETATQRSASPASKSLEDADDSKSSLPSIFTASTNSKPVGPSKDSDSSAFANSLFGASPFDAKPQTSIFGAGATKPASTSQSASSIFGTPAENGKGITAASGSSVQAASSSSAQPASSSGPTPFIFGASAQGASPKQSGGLFGSKPKVDEKPVSVFGSSTGLGASSGTGGFNPFAAAQSGFMSNSEPAREPNSIFGDSKDKTAQSSTMLSSLFGSSTSTASATPFGSSAPNSGGLFGTPAATSANIFGSSSNALGGGLSSTSAGTNPFGVSSAPNGSSSLFGTSSATGGAASQSIFGAASSQPAGGSSLFGVSNPFGATSGAAGIEGGSLFGSHEADPLDEFKVATRRKTRR